MNFSWDNTQESNGQPDFPELHLIPGDQPGELALDITSFGTGAQRSHTCTPDGSIAPSAACRRSRHQLFIAAAYGDTAAATAGRMDVHTGYRPAQHLEQR